MFRKILRIMKITTSAAASAVLLFSCATFPKPTDERSSLLVLVFEGRDDRTDTRDSFSETLVFEGPERLKLDIPFQSRKVFTVPVIPGTYRMTARDVTHSWGSGGNTWAAPPASWELIVPENSIVLYPLIFTARAAERTDYRPGTNLAAELDQQRVSDELSDMIGFSEWIGRLFIGFGRYPPRLTLRQDEYRLQINSNPQGAEVVIDNEVQGSTPIAVDLRAGKHLVEVRKEGMATWRSYIDADSDNEINVELSTVTQDAAGGDPAAAGIARNQYGLVVTPFRNLGKSEDDHLRGVFDQALSAAFSRDGRIALLTAPEEAEQPDQRTTTLKPDFGPALKTGADLMISGDYFTEDDRLLIHASLYDVQKENVKADILYASRTGFSIFDSIDEMTREFDAAVDRVLPGSGREIVQKRQTVSTEITTMEKKVSERDVVNRRGRKKHDLALTLGFGAVMDSVDYYDPVEALDKSTSRYNGPGLGAGFSYTYHFNSWIGLNLMFAPSFGFSGELGPAVDFPFFMGPEFTFSGLFTDFYFRLLAQVRRSEPQEIRPDDGDFGETDEFFFRGFSIDAGTKIYLYRRYSSPGWYANIGMRFSPFLERSTNAEFSENRTTVPLDLMLYAGMGVRL